MMEKMFVVVALAAVLFSASASSPISERSFGKLSFLL